MNLTVINTNGMQVASGTARTPVLKRVEDASKLIEACYGLNCSRLLLYPENLTPQFFDLSSGEAGEILQKLRNYHIRLGVVRTPALQMSSRFHEILAEEQRGGYFGLFDTPALALA